VLVRELRSTVADDDIATGSVADRCLLSGVIQTSHFKGVRTVFDPKPKSSTPRVSAFYANGDRDGPDCASAPNSEPSSGERSDPSCASRARCG
jgi:hypothetical protein